MSSEGEHCQQDELPLPFRWQVKLQDLLVPQCPPGIAFTKMYNVINLQKAGTLPFCLVLMWYYKNWSPQAWLYTVSHGTYGLCWLLKHCVFPDPKWDRYVSLFGAVNSWAGVLGLYWIAPYLLISRSVRQPSLARCALSCIVSYMGIAMMMLADAQKYFTLRAKRGLITDGMYSYMRHPNYMGEMLLYGGFAAMVPTPIPAAVLLWVWTMLFAPNIVCNERRMARYGAAWETYKARTWYVCPNPSVVLRDLLAQHKPASE